MNHSELMSDSDPDPLRRREAYVARVRGLLSAVGLTEARLNRKIDEQLQTDGGLDALGFAELEKVIEWLDGKQRAKEEAARRDGDLIRPRANEDETLGRAG